MDVRHSARITLGCLALLAVYAKYYLSLQNGFIPLLSSLKAKNSLPGDEGLLRTHYTGCRRLDDFLAACTLFFWPVLSGNSVPLSLYALAFAGGMVPTWVILSTHAWRSANPLKSLVRNMLGGLAIQIIGPGVMVPVLLAIQSPALKRARDIPSGYCLSTPIVVFYGAPLFLASAAAPRLVSAGMKQQLIAFWQGWSVSVSLSAPVLRWLAARLPRSGSSERTVTYAREHIFAFAFLCSALPHWTMIGIVFLVQLGVPPSCHDGKSLIVPRLSWGGKHVASIEEGIQHFLQWDYGISAVALLTWCVALYHHHAGIPAVWIKTVCGLMWVLVVACLCGPCSAALWLYYEAESIAFAKEA
nr:terpene cyclase [Aspergillus striatus]